MAEGKRVRVGLVGCGYYAQNHLNSWSDLRAQGADLVAVCDIDRAKAEDAGRKFGVPAFSDATEMFDALPIDLVDITTRMGSHRALAAIAAERGIGAVVQKPFAPTWEDSVAIVETALKHDAWLAVHENFRFETSMRRVKAVLDSGAIGRPNWARISFRTGYDVYKGQPYLADEERLVILDVGIHVLDLARWLLGEVALLSCETQKRNPRLRAEDTATMMLRHESGAVSVVESTYEARRIPDSFPETLLEIEGPEGSIIVKHGERMVVTTQGLSFEETISGSLLPWTSRPWHVSQEAVLHTNAHMLDAFCNGRPAETSGADNLKTYALVEAAYEFSGKPLRSKAEVLEGRRMMRTTGERRRRRDLRELRLVVPNTRLRSVRRRVAAQVARLVRSGEDEALSWIEAISEFDAPNHPSDEAR